MAKRFARFSAKEMQEAQESLAQMNLTCARLIESILNVVDKAEGTPAYKESLKANFLLSAAGVLLGESRTSQGLADSLQMVADDLRECKNPAAGDVEALAHAMRAWLKRR